MFVLKEWLKSLRKRPHYHVSRKQLRGIVRKRALILLAENKRPKYPHLIGEKIFCDARTFRRR
jgi:hypothetical protein